MVVVVVVVVVVVLINWNIFFQVCASENDNEENSYFVAPTGLLFNEVTASSVLKVDHKGNVVETGNTNLGISQSAFELHATIHSTRKDAKCVLFLSADSVKAVSIVFWQAKPVKHSRGNLAFKHN